MQGLQRVISAIAKLPGAGFDAIWMEAGKSRDEYIEKTRSALSEAQAELDTYSLSDRFFNAKEVIPKIRLLEGQIDALTRLLGQLEDENTIIFEKMSEDFTEAADATAPFIEGLRDTADELREQAKAVAETTTYVNDYDDAILRVARAQEAANEKLAEARRLQDALNVSVSAYNTSADERIAKAAEQADLSAFEGIQRTLEEIRIEEERLATAAKDRIQEQFANADPEILAQQLAAIDAVTQRTIQARQEAARQIDANVTAFRKAEEQKAEAARAAEEAARNAQKSFAEGWKTAFDEYAKNATDAGKQAERLFNKTTSSMEDSIVNFAKTGKFEFKDLINTILEELLRSQIQRLIAQTFGAFGGGSSGGFNPFAGFFANGGLIPSGKFGVVGENGPELVSGPANITPMDGLGGGGSQVIYNINAVDAPSFKAMIARDPGFIHAVAQQGARKVPVRR